MAEKRIDIVIRARNEARAAFEEAARNAQALGASLKLPGAGSGDGGLFGMATLALKFGAAINAARGALTIARSATELLSGDFEHAADALEKLPLGIGPVVRETRELLMLWTGATAEVKRYNDEVKQSERALGEQKKRLEASRKLWGGQPGVTDLEQESRRRLELARAAGDVEATERIKRRQELQNRLAAIEAAAVASGTTNSARVAAIKQNERDAAQNEFAAWMQERTEAEAKRTAELQKEQSEARRRQIEFESETTELRVELEARGLRARGQTLAAEAALVREHYRQLRAEVARSETAITAEQRISRIAALRELEASDLAAVASRQRKGLSGGVASAVRGERYTGLAERFGAEQQVQQRIAGHAGAIASDVRRAITLLQHLTTKTGPLGMGGIEGYLVPM